MICVKKISKRDANSDTNERRSANPIIQKKKYYFCYILFERILTSKTNKFLPGIRKSM